MITQYYIPGQPQNNDNGGGGGFGILIITTIALVVAGIVYYNSESKLKIEMPEANKGANNNKPV
ncbi:MAG: hypothetical protein NTY88_12485 [Bacteroidetes bacterium]|nr:hypothetical protein [Bacteroidota bacterium]